MKTFRTAYDLDRYPVAAGVSRAIVGAAAAGAFVAAWVTAGPGNGYLPPQQWSAEFRADTPRVTLPPVTVVGRRDDARRVAAVSCPKGA